MAKFFPKSDKRLENFKGWRIFKVLYFPIGFIAVLIYSLQNSWLYTNCPPHRGRDWEEVRLLCVEFFDWGEFIGYLVLTAIIFYALYPVIELSLRYIVFGTEPPKGKEAADSE